eukprot:m.343446 g.343446  ORF g.343446 m.343446 type:complete len:381 (-) comp22832_c0_seq1:24-1166(-)
MKSPVVCLFLSFLFCCSAQHCKDDLDCSLNGECTRGLCECRSPWNGSACDSLVFLPTPINRGYGGQNKATWGGSVALGDDGLYHMYVAEIVNNCSLHLWTSNSRCSHVVSSTPLGPYSFRNVALDVWCTNPAIVTQRDNSTKKLSWFLFSMGGGTPRKPVQNCSNGSGILKTPSEDEEAYEVSALHVASSPDGPFEYVNLTIDNCNNPSPLVHPNGTWYLVCHHYDLYKADSYKGPWTQVPTELGPLPNGDGAEDPYIWIDEMGNWHSLFHASRRGSDDTNCEAGHSGSIVAAHIFSKDGLVWNQSAPEPFTNVIALEGGKDEIVATRERPKLIFNSKGIPTHLISGISAGASSCAPTPCINCKYSTWVMTNVSPLHVEN